MKKLKKNTKDKRNLTTIMTDMCQLVLLESDSLEVVYQMLLIAVLVWNSNYLGGEFEIKKYKNSLIEEVGDHLFLQELLKIVDTFASHIYQKHFNDGRYINDFSLAVDLNGNVKIDRILWSN